MKHQHNRRGGGTFLENTFVLSMKIIYGINKCTFSSNKNTNKVHLFVEHVLHTIICRPPFDIISKRNTTHSVGLNYSNNLKYIFYTSKITLDQSSHDYLVNALKNLRCIVYSNCRGEISKPHLPAANSHQFTLLRAKIWA